LRYFFNPLNPQGGGADLTTALYFFFYISLILVRINRNFTINFYHFSITTILQIFKNNGRFGANNALAEFNQMAKFL